MKSQPYSHTYCHTSQAKAQTKTWQRVCLSKRIKDSETHERQKWQQLTAVLRNGGFIASYDSLVLKQTLLFRINICGKIVNFF
jgi:hypothetical protein